MRAKHSRRCARNSVGELLSSPGNPSLCRPDDPIAIGARRLLLDRRRRRIEAALVERSEARIGRQFGLALEAFLERYFNLRFPGAVRAVRGRQS